MEKIIYRNISDTRVDIIVVSGKVEETIGQVYLSSGLKWKIKAYFPVNSKFIDLVEGTYDGPIEAGGELAKAWKYYVSWDPFFSSERDPDEIDDFFGDFFK